MAKIWEKIVDGWYLLYKNVVGLGECWLRRCQLYSRNPEKRKRAVAFFRYEDFSRSTLKRFIAFAERETDQGVLDELAMYFDLYPGPDQIDILIRRFDDLGGILPRCLVASAQAGHNLAKDHGRMIQKHLQELRAGADRQKEARHAGPLQLVNTLIGGLMEFDDPDLAPVFEENLVYALKVPPEAPIHNQAIPLAGSCLLALETLKIRGLASLLNVYGDSAGILSDSTAARHIGKILTTLPEDQASAAVEVCRRFQSEKDLLSLLQRISSDTYMYTAEERRKVDRLRTALTG